MLPNTTTDSGQQAGAQGANPVASPPVGVQPNSQTPDLSVLVKNLQAEVNALKGDKDRGVSRVSKELDNIKPMLEKVMQFVELTPDQQRQIQRDFEFDAMKQQVYGSPLQPSAPASQGSGAVSATQFGEFDVLQFLGMSTSDPEVSNALIQANGNPLNLAVSLGELRARRAVQSPPNPAVNAGLVSGAAPIAPNRAEMVAGYKNELQAARGSKTAVRDIQSKYRTMGLDVDNIGLSI